jgi:ankyrin repeat protein
MATDFVSQLKDAVKSNDVDRIKTILWSAWESNKFDQSLLRAGLMESAKERCENATAQLLNESAGFIAAGVSMLESPFLKAVQGDYLAIAGLMLNAGVNPNTTRHHHVGDDGWSALHIACGGGSLEMVNLLMGANADCNLKTLDGRTPLVLAVDRGEKEVVSALLRQKGLAMRDTAGNHIFFRAALSNHWEIAELLAPGNSADTFFDCPRGLHEISVALSRLGAGDWGVCLWRFTNNSLQPALRQNPRSPVHCLSWFPSCCFSLDSLAC